MIRSLLVKIVGDRHKLKILIYKQQKRRKISLKVKNISTNDGQKKSINLGLKYNKVYAAKCILK